MSSMDEFVKSNPQLLAANSKYAPKLTFQDRCAALAAVKKGIIKTLVATAFGINVSTLDFISSPSSKHYRNVRRELADLGEDRFISTYLTDEYVERFVKARNKLEAEGRTETQKQHDARMAADRVKAHGPDRRANGLAGRKVVDAPYIGTLLIDIMFVKPEPFISFDSDRPEGWYIYVDPTSPAYDPVNHKGHYGFATDALTSKSCWRAFLSATQAEEKS